MNTVALTDISVQWTDTWVDDTTWTNRWTDKWSEKKTPILHNFKVGMTNEQFDFMTSN